MPTTTGIKLGRFEWTTRVEGGDEFTFLSVGDVEVGYVSKALDAPAFDWLLTVGDWASNPAPLATLSAAKADLAHNVRIVISRTPGNDYHEFCEMSLKPLPCSHIED